MKTMISFTSQRDRTKKCRNETAVSHQRFELVNNDLLPFNRRVDSRTAASCNPFITSITLNKAD